MKRCPTCNRIYTDETLSYCLMDGALLLSNHGTAETQRIAPARLTNLAPTVVMPAVPQGPQAAAPQGARTTQTLLYVIIALLALLAAVFAVAWMRSGGPQSVPDERTGATASSPAPTQEATRADASTVTPQGTPAPSLTEDAVRNLIERWRLAQNSRDFAAYQSCYDTSFEGIKRTASGREERYGYSGWMQDRRRMITRSLGLNVEVTSLQISITGDTAEVSFTQTYRSASYSDQGRKLMRVRRTASGDRIVYEDLKDSRPL